MIFIVGILTVALILNCILLIFLVLVQLPKKDAGAGLAFGGGAADALFGAGSGNALTKVTKYGTITLFVIALLLGYLQEQSHRSNSSDFLKAVQGKQTESQMGAPASTVPPGTPPPTTASATASATSQTNSVLSMPLPTDTNSTAK
jgi:protein translocase SecG subunit